MRPFECLPLFIGLLLLSDFFSSNAIAQSRNTQPEKIEHKRGKEERDESKIINVTDAIAKIKPDGIVTIRGQVFPPDDLKQDRETAIKTAEEGLEALKKLKREGNLDEVDLTILKTQIEKAESAIHDVRQKKTPIYNTVMALVVEGKGRPSSAQYSTLSYVTSDITELKPDKSDIRTYQIEFKMPSQPGFYTVILTPIDATSLPGGAIVGASDTITIEVVEPIGMKIGPFAVTD